MLSFRVRVRVWDRVRVRARVRSRVRVRVGVGVGLRVSDGETESERRTLQLDYLIDGQAVLLSHRSRGRQPTTTMVDGGLFSRLC